ncbi:MAG: type II toxin-antitoxin system HipA family toxin [Actinomycetota bacterium]
MTPELRVLLDGRPVGTLARLTNGRLRFEYDAAYQDERDPTPLSLSMPVQERSHGHATVSPWLWGLLPDDVDVLRRWAREFGVSSVNPFSLLGTPIGEDCAGGVQFVPPNRIESLMADTGSVEWLTAADVEVRLRLLRADATAWLGDERVERSRAFVGQFSLAGRQRKTALLFDDDRWGVPSGRIPTTHILKPPIEGFRDQELTEHLCLDAASRVGLIAAESRVACFGAESAVVITRYDRLRSDGRVGRVHQEDLCQALSVAPEHKYQSEGGPGPAEIARLIRAAMPAEAAETNVRRFADALIWNWIIAGTDAHAKNYSLLLAGRQVRLAPLYDLTSALPYENERHLRLAMKVGDGYELVNYRNPWPKTASRMGLDEEWLTARVAELCERAPQAFTAAAEEQEIVTLNRPSTRRLVDLVENRAARCAKLMG